MITYGSLALNIQPDLKHEMMIEFLSAENGYWLENDVWRSDSKAYLMSGFKNSQVYNGVLVNFSSFSNEVLKLEMKYYLLISMKKHWKASSYVQRRLKKIVRIAGEMVASDDRYYSFYGMDESVCCNVPENFSEEDKRIYHALMAETLSFYAEFYDEREETEKDDAAVAKYGEKARNGVVEITSKKK